MSDTATIGSQIRDWRAVAGIGRHIASQRLGVSKRTLEAWEQGRYQPEGDLRARVLAVLSGKHEALPDLRDAMNDLAAAAARIRRAISAGALGIGAKDRLPKIAAGSEKYAAEIEAMLGKEGELVPPAGSVL